MFKIYETLSDLGSKLQLPSQLGKGRCKTISPHPINVTGFDATLNLRMANKNKKKTLLNKLNKFSKHSGGGDRVQTFIKIYHIAMSQCRKRCAGEHCRHQQQGF